MFAWLIILPVGAGLSLIGTWAVLEFREITFKDFNEELNGMFELATKFDCGSIVVITGVVVNEVLEVELSALPVLVSDFQLN